MPMGLRVRTNVDDVLRQMDDWVDQAKTVAVPRALNRLAQQGQTAGFRKVAQIYDIGPRTMEKFAVLKFAVPGNPEATITVKGIGFPLIAFQARQTRAGVSVRVKGRRFVVPHAFIATMRSGHRGVFARGAYGGKSQRKIERTGEVFGRYVYGRKRLPINELYTLSPPDAVSNPDVVDEIDRRVAEQAAKVLEQEISFATRR